MKIGTEALYLILIYILVIIQATAQLCPICRDGSYPRNEDMILHIFPGYMPRLKYSCKELYFIGNENGVIGDDICESLVTVATKPCGCVSENALDGAEWDISTDLPGEAINALPPINMTTTTLSSPPSASPMTDHVSPKKWSKLPPIASPSHAPTTTIEVSFHLDDALLNGSFDGEKAFENKSPGHGNLRGV